MMWNAKMTPWSVMSEKFNPPSCFRYFWAQKIQFVLMVNPITIEIEVKELLCSCLLTIRLSFFEPPNFPLTNQRKHLSSFFSSFWTCAPSVEVGSVLVPQKEWNVEEEKKRAKQFLLFMRNVLTNTIFHFAFTLLFFWGSDEEDTRCFYDVVIF